MFRPRQKHVSWSRGMCVSVGEGVSDSRCRANTVPVSRESMPTLRNTPGELGNRNKSGSLNVLGERDNPLFTLLHKQHHLVNEGG